MSKFGCSKSKSAQGRSGCSRQPPSEYVGANPESGEFPARQNVQGSKI